MNFLIIYLFIFYGNGKIILSYFYSMRVHIYVNVFLGNEDVTLNIFTHNYEQYKDLISVKNKRKKVFFLIE